MSTKTSKWSSFKLRMQLLRIWFMKNILVWLQVFLIVCVVCMLTGNITAETPLLGSLVYPIFKPLVDEITEIVSAKQIDGLMDFFAVFISVVMSVGMFTLKVKGIAQSDIKNDKLKIALIRANLYFNEDGKLVKKVERLTGQDIDGDGCADDSRDAKVTTGVISGVVTAMQEFSVIVSADLSEADSFEDDKYKQVLKDADLEKSADALKEIDNTVSEGVTDMAVDATIKTLKKNAKKTKESKTLTRKEKENRVSLFTKLKEWFKSLKKKRERKKAEKEKDNDIIVNNIENDSTIKIDKKEGKIINPVQEFLKSQSSIVANTVKPKAASRSSADDVLAGLKK